MRRYGVFSVTGYLTPVVGGGIDPPTVWYVTDNVMCGEIVYRTPYETVAREKAFQLNARQRTLDKEQERACA
jgi:hypothetical protein